MISSDTSRRAPDPSEFSRFFEGMRSEPVYVVLGVQGSGTNLLRRILSKVFNFVVIQDQALIYNAALAAGPRPSPEVIRRQFDAIRRRLFPSAAVRKTQRRIKSNTSFEGIERAFDVAAIRSGADLARFVYAYGAFMRGTRAMAIKSDDLWETIGAIDTVLPHRRIILLTRDFRDNLLSITKKNFGPVDPLIAAAYVDRRFRPYDAEYQRAAPEHRIHVRYEDLLSEPDAFVTRFGRHFTLVGEDGLPPVDTTRIRKDNVRKWKSLSRRQLAMCEAVLREALDRYGYDLESEPVEPEAVDWMSARLSDAVKRVPQKLRLVIGRLSK